MASMTGLSPQQLAQLLAGEDAMAMPTYSLPSVYDGVLPVGLGVQGTKRNRGDAPPAWNSNSEPWPGAIDQIMAPNSITRRDIIQNIPAPPVQTASNYSTLDTVTPLDINRLGLTSSPFAVPAERAIAEILIQGGMRAPTGGTNRGHPARRGGGLMFEPVTPAGPAPAGDPWQTLRTDPRTVERPGMVTGNRSGSLMAQPDQSSGGGLMGTPVPSGSVTIASGKTVPVGTSGTAQGGRYEYVVQPDGSVKNITTGRVTAPATR